MPLHFRMRVIDRDLIRGGHYGQRSYEPHKQAEHMAAPTNSANVKISLANSEPSTHGTKRTFVVASAMSVFDWAVPQLGPAGSDTQWRSPMPKL